MRLVEIRDLDGPNIFLLAPALKLEFAVQPEDERPEGLQRLRERLRPLGVDEASDPDPDAPEELGAVLAEAVAAVHRRSGVEAPACLWVGMETPGQFTLAWPWRRRAFTIAVARLVASAAVGEEGDFGAAMAELPGLLDGDDPEDRPLMIRDSERRIPAIGVTGTNGKTTTTRLIAHTLQLAGVHPGWTSTSGVFIDGELVLEGDYSGPAGARRVLGDPAAEVAVLESARGGILLRGLAYESNDISVFTNVSGDHLGLHGIHTVRGLAQVKALVCRVTRPEGWAVLNADDALVRGATAGLRAKPFWVTQDPTNPTVLADLAEGGRAVLLDDGWIVEARGGDRHPIVPVAEVPITFGGRAAHMVENTLCAAAACLAVGRSHAEVAAGLRDFGSRPDDNLGRNDVYRHNGGIAIIDYAHNEAGVIHLWKLARSFVEPGGRLTAVIGSAGDRTDEHLRTLGRLAGEAADRVVMKGTQKYLRGRQSTEEIEALMAAGVAEAGKGIDRRYETEAEAIAAEVRMLGPGDVVAVMCFENPAEAQAVAAAAAIP